MSANPELVKQRNIPEEDVEKINALHEKIETLIEKRAGLGVFNPAVYEEIERMEFALQLLWRFPQDPRMHTWKNRYSIKCFKELHK